MSDNENPKRRPLKNSRPEGFQPKVWLIWAAIIALAVAVATIPTGGKAAPVKLNIQQVVELAEKGEVKEGEIKADPAGGPFYSVITGKFATPQKNADGLDSERFTAAGRMIDANMARLQATRLFKEPAAETLLSSIAMNILMVGLIIGVFYFLFVRQIRAAGRGALNFGKSRAKLLTRDRDKVTFKDVAGCDEAKEEVAEIVEFLKDPKKFQKMGGRIPKGVLMVGPPGTGKTLLAKAVAGEADVPFFSISGSDFVEMFVGVGASRVRDMFEQGRKNAPCLIFIDEIDAVGRQRGAGLGGGNDEREQTLNSLLVEMDGFDTTEGVIIIAATNRPDVLDSALLRPGRFDRQVFIDLPDMVGREQILRVHAKKINLGDDVDLAEIGRATAGLSGAELANLLNEGALMAARRNKKKVERIDIEDAREKILFGRERRRMMDEGEKRMTAWHEAGHALIGAVLEDEKSQLHKVTILPRGRALGMAMYVPKKEVLSLGKKEVLNRIAMALGGRIAEELVFDDISNGAASDIQQVTKLARHMVCDWGMSELGPIAYGENQDTIFLGREISRTESFSEATAQKIDGEVRRIVDEQYARATAILKERRAALDGIAEALLQYETIEGKHVTEIITEGRILSPVTHTIPPVLDDKPEKRGPGSDKKISSTDLGASGPASAPTPA
ncbi:MAG: ATP-dependent zinc metalloprotease FtsH [Opitutaceae bacterium]